jgi:phosphoserine phosphatase
MPPTIPFMPTVACDLDGTITAGSTWNGMRRYLVIHGRRRTVRLFDLLNVHKLLAYKLGLINSPDFKENLVARFLRVFKGFTVEEFNGMAEWTVDNELAPQCYDAVLSELRGFRTKGYRVLILSGLFDPLPKVLAQRLDMSGGLGTPMAVENDIVLGRTTTPFNVGPRKAAQLAPYAAHDGFIHTAYGDSSRDIPMLEISRHPVAVNPEEKLRKTATERGWRILET